MWFRQYYNCFSCPSTKKFNLLEGLFPNIVKADDRKITVKPHFHVSGEHFTALPDLEKKLGHRFCFVQRITVPVQKKLANSMAQSVIGNSPTGVDQMDNTIELVDSCMVITFQIIFDPPTTTIA